MPECSGFLYKVREGDTIVSIAKKHGVKLARIIAANSHLHNPTRLEVGDEICVPLGENSKQVVDTELKVQLPVGYRIRKYAGDLTFPTGITFNDAGEMFVAESGYKAGTVSRAARILRVDPNGSTTETVRGFSAPILGLTWHRGYFYVAESGYPGQITRIAPDGTRNPVVKGLPTGGDHGLGEIVFGPGDTMYFGVGTATNSGVVGPDNNWLGKRPKFHDFICRDYELAGENFASENPLAPAPVNTIVTGAFRPAGISNRPDEVIKRSFPGNGAIMQANPDGTGLRVYADGLRNPVGLGIGPDGSLFATSNGEDNRGSRPVAGAWDTFEQVCPGKWYGWHDYNARIPLTDPCFKPSGGPQPQFLIKNHPPLADGPVTKFTPHSAAAKFDFSTNGLFGYPGEAFVALFGQLCHEGVLLPEPAGFKVVRVNVTTGETNDFMLILNPGQGDGPVHPIQARFDASGLNLYVVDFGQMGDTGHPPAAKTGAIWVISRNS